MPIYNERHLIIVEVRINLYDGIFVNFPNSKRSFLAYYAHNVYGIKFYGCTRRIACIETCIKLGINVISHIDLKLYKYFLFRRW